MTETEQQEHLRVRMHAIIAEENRAIHGGEPEPSEVCENWPCELVAKLAMRVARGEGN